jgi:hypothetical protein
METGLKAAAHGDGQYKTSTVDLSGDTAPTKIPSAGPVQVESETYTTSSGQFRSAPTVWQTANWIKDAQALIEKLGLGQDEAIELTIDAADGQARAYAKQELTDALAQTATEAKAGAGADVEAGAGEVGGREGASRDGDTGDTCGTTGLGDSGQSTHQNQGSERSDRISGLDICFVNPPVEERCNRLQWSWLVRRARTIQEQWIFLYLADKSRVQTYASGVDDEDGWTGLHNREDLHKKFKVPYPTSSVYEGSSLIEVKDNGRYISPEEAEKRGIDPKTREFRVKQEALDEWTRLGAEGGAYRYKAQRRELVRTREPQPMTTQLYDDNRNNIPALVENALEVLTDADHQIVLDAIEEAEESIAEREGAEAREQLTSLRLAKETVERQVIQSQDGVAQLQNAYEIQSISGRVSFRRGGPQGLLGEVKARAYDLPGYRNFDIASCHTSAFKQVAKMLGDIGVDIDVSAWENYAGKYEVAARTGLPVGLVKVVEHAVKYGAVIPDSMEQVRKFYVDEDDDSGDRSNWPSLAKEVKEHEEQGLLDDADDALKALNDVFGEMREVVIEMAEALLTDYYDAHHSGGWMENACGVSFGRHTWAEGHEQRSKVMAWMLQGLESAFCHWITILSADSEAFTVVANEHDGLIIRKDVESEQAFQEALSAAISKAQERSGFEEAEFVEKAFADEEDVAEVYGEQETVETAEQEAEDEGNAQAGAGGAEAPAQAPETQPNDRELYEQHMERKREKKRRRRRGGLSEEQLRQQHEQEAQWREEHPEPDVEPA